MSNQSSILERDLEWSPIRHSDYSHVSNSLMNVQESELKHGWLNFQKEKPVFPDI